MNKNFCSLLTTIVLCIFILSCAQESIETPLKEPKQDISLTLEEAEKLVQLPFECIQKEYPYKAGLTISSLTDLQLPKVHHPAFYGCFDWHSAVHGHWSIVYLLSEFPNLSQADELKKMLSENLSADNIQKEIDYFSLNEYTSSFERTYGWAWLLKLTEELHRWNDPVSEQLYLAIEPLANYIVEAYIAYLPKLAYPIRVGEHSNTAFGLSFAYDYAIYFKQTSLKEAITEKALDFYMYDQGCPISWEPSGYDFLSPCLQEIDVMRKVLPETEFKSWIQAFLPSVVDGSLSIEPARVIDRTDGKLVHLSGLNFSRAWCLYPLREYIPEHKEWILRLADDHIQASKADIFGDHYSGGHWLGSFILYALQTKSDL